MVVVSAVVIGMIVVAIALVAVGRATAELSASPPSALFDLDQAVGWVADRLPDEVTAQLSYDDVGDLLGWHLDYLEAKGVAADGSAGTPVAGPAVAADDEAVAYVLARAEEAGLEVTDDEVVEVVEAAEAYLVAIGAVGRPVPAPPDPAER